MSSSKLSLQQLKNIEKDRQAESDDENEPETPPKDALRKMLVRDLGAG